MSDYVKQHAVASTFAAGESWTVLSEIEQSIKRKIEAVGVPLKDMNININYGVKTGFNDAFIIDGATKDRLIAEDPKSAEIIRPILRGRDIKRYSYSFADQWLIATFPARRYDINQYPAIKKYLRSYGEARLAQSGEKDINGIKGNNARKKTSNQWFETQDTIAYWDDFSKQKIVWAELARTGNAFVYDESKFVVLNTAYILVFGGSKAVDSQFMKACTVFFNSRLSLFFLDHITSRFDENGYRWLKQYVELLPLPNFDQSNTKRLSSLYDGISDARKNGKNVSRLEKEANEFIERLLNISDVESAFLEQSYPVR